MSKLVIKKFRVMFFVMTSLVMSSALKELSFMKHRNQNGRKIEKIA